MNVDNQLRKLMSELDDSRGHHDSVNSTIERLEKGRREAEAQFNEVRQKAAEIQKRIQRDGASKSRIDAEIRKIKE